MHYEHTTKAIVSFIVGFYLLVMYIVVGLCGYSYMPFGTVAPNMFVSLFHECINLGFILGPVLIALGAIGFYREYWVRKLERHIRG